MESICVSAPPRTTTADWKSCLDEQQIPLIALSPIDEFYIKHEGLTALSGLMDQALRPELVSVLSDQLLLGYVSATELYFRRLLAVSARLCPEIRLHVADVEIPFGALDFYPRDQIEYALTEKITLTEQGKVRNLLESRFGIPVSKLQNLQRAIEQFEKLCHLRHALVHSSGVVNSRNAHSLGHVGSRAICKVRLDVAELQLAASVCMDLVRTVNDETAKHVLWTWLRGGHLKGQRTRDNSQLIKFLAAYASVSDVRLGAEHTSLEELHNLCKTVIRDMAASRLKDAEADASKGRVAVTT